MNLCNGMFKNRISTNVFREALSALVRNIFSAHFIYNSEEHLRYRKISITDCNIEMINKLLQPLHSAKRKTLLVCFHHRR